MIMLTSSFESTGMNEAYLYNQQLSDTVIEL